MESSSKCVIICLAVSFTISHAVDLPIPNNPASVLYSMLMASFQIVRASDNGVALHGRLFSLPLDHLFSVQKPGCMTG